ncbi:sulfotransferase domain-containing protein [Ilyomonas limi]|uniref:Sulfotransferase domain-containing protein n=1 Tax=Ilyomonas limi TaxID=2575867 RepID=A0A4U3L9A9_9BACT|nr:sulfotransferase domain-containing protein [Ilyomonas limi]TKK71975.1 sulfotransferase domain-containing protein [Ilyomonas limi]
MQTPVFPNTFIIGVQKAGTTTLNDWLSQHPEIYGYDTLKDVHLFARFKNMAEIKERLQQEPVPYKGEPVVLQSAVNYVFYEQMLRDIALQQPEAKLIIILRNPVQRAFSAYGYFKKMLREKRTVHEALMYKPKDALPFSKENNDITYIEHGFYFIQIKNCLKYFKKEQLLVLEYEELKNPQVLLQKIFTFLQVNPSFQPNLEAKNVTGTTKSTALQKGIIGQNKLKKFIIKYLVDFWMPVTRRKKLKAKLFEMNTTKAAPAKTAAKDTSDTTGIKQYLEGLYKEDVKQLDALLQTNFYSNWFAAKESEQPKQAISNA